MKNPSDNPAHDLIPEAIAGTIPRLYVTQNADDPVAHGKLFTPDSFWTWYVTEYDPEERLCFGLVHSYETEWGYFSLDELTSARGPMNLPIERDWYFDPTPISRCC